MDLGNNCPFPILHLFVHWNVRKWWAIIFIFFSNPIIGNSDLENKLTHAWNLIGSNCNNAAILEIEGITFNALSLSNQLKCLEIKKYALFFNQEYNAFHSISREIHSIEKPSPSSSSHALYLAEQAFFFHYLTWKDSVLVYMNECEKLIKNHHPVLKEKEGAFVHMMLANYQLYLDSEDDPAYSKRYHQIDKYFKKAVGFMQTPSPINGRLLSAIYRSWASRTMDRVSGYQSLTKEEANKRPAYKKKLDSLAAKRFERAARIAPDICVDDKIYALSIEGTLYSTIGQCEKADSIFKRCFVLLKKQYGELKYAPGLKSLCILLKYKMGNDLKMYGSIPDEDEYIQHFQEIQPSYSTQLQSSEQFRYDTYGSSPTHMLGCLLLQKGKKENNQKILIEGAQYLIENFDTRFASKTDSNLEKAIRIWTANNEIHFNFTSRTSSHWKATDLPFPHSGKKDKSFVPKIQSALDENEIIIYKSWPSSMLSNYRLVIGKNNIDWINCNNCVNAALDPVNEPSFPQFKKWAWENYQKHLQPILKAFPKTNKINVYFNDLTDYDCLIDHPNGDHYSELSFIAKKIQINRIYNIQNYFLDQPVTLNKKIHLTSLIQPMFKPLLFTIDMLKNLFFSSFRITNEEEQELHKIIETKDIVHLYGHGQFQRSLLGYDQFSMPYFESNKWNDLKSEKTEFSKCNSLLIFNTCFSGTSSMVFEYDSDLHTQMLLKGAPAIVTSPIRSEDEASAEIFSNFYQMIEEGTDHERAFYLAKINYLKKQEGENCNPHRWNAYRMISQNKIVPFQPLTCWEKLVHYLVNLQYLFSPPVLS